MIVIALPDGVLRQGGAGRLRRRGGRGLAAPGDRSIRAVLRRPAFYLLALGSMCSIGAVGGTIQNLKLYLSLDRGLRPGPTSRDVLSLVLVGSLAGRLLMGWLADRVARRST